MHRAHTDQSSNSKKVQANHNMHYSQSIDSLLTDLCLRKQQKVQGSQLRRVQ